MVKKLFILSILIIIFICIFCGCGKQKYDAEMYSHANKWANEKFLKENMTYGAYYLNDEYNEEDDSSEKYLKDNISPESRTLIFKDKEEFDKIFVNFPAEIDFNKEMVFVYIFTDCSPRDYSIKNLEISEGTLVISYKLDNPNKLKFWKSNILDSVAPYQRCFAVKTRKLDVNEVKFAEVSESIENK